MKRWIINIMESLAFFSLFATWAFCGCVLIKYDGEMIAFLGLFNTYGWEMGMHYFYLMAFIVTWTLLGIAIIIIVKLYKTLKKYQREQTGNITDF